MQQIWTEDIPVIPLYVRAKIEVHKNSLVNWEVSGGTTQSTYKATIMYFK